ncbi:MAG: phage tail protein [Chloroflexota bacterium]|nr:phage tail protein [Chloroflexota bacterium]
MPQFAVNPNRFDPYKNFKFRVKWDGRFVAGITRVSALRRATEVVEHREGGDPSIARRSPGRTRFEPIVLERGVTHDTEFEDWANILIELYNEAGQLVIAYRVFRCWVSEFQPLPELDATTGRVAIQSITLQHEGWDRDEQVAEPEETSA